MGEVADMMIEGYLCERCGTVVDEQEPGHPRLCKPCIRETGSPHGADPE